MGDGGFVGGWTGGPRVTGDLGTPSSNPRSRALLPPSPEPRLCSHVGAPPGGGGDAGDPEQAEKQWIPPWLGFRPLSPFPCFSGFSAAFRVSPLFSSLCVCAYEICFDKIEPYHM